MQVRAIGRLLGVPETFIKRHPFPGPGMGVRILGDVTEGDRLEVRGRGGSALRRGGSLGEQRQAVELTEACVDCVRLASFCSSSSSNPARACWLRCKHSRVLLLLLSPSLPQVLRMVDEIYVNTIKEFGLYDEIWQAFAVFLPIKSVGVQGDQRTHRCGYGWQG